MDDLSSAARGRAGGALHQPDRLIVRDFGESTRQWGGPDFCAEQMPAWGRQLTLPGVTVYDVAMDSFELHVKLAGYVFEYAVTPSSSRIAINSDRQETRRFDRGTAFFAPAGAEVWRTSPPQAYPDGPHTLLALSVDPDHVATLFGDLLDGRPLAFAEKGPPVLDVCMSRAAEGLRACVSNIAAVPVIGVEALVHQMLYRGLLRWSNLATQIRPVPARPDARVVQQAIDYIQANLTGKLSVKDLAPVTGLNIDTLTRLFKQATGRTPYDYILEQRVARAKQALKQGKAPLAEVAVACGFGNQSHFSTVFKKWTGLSPARYRRQARI